MSSEAVPEGLPRGLPDFVGRSSDIADVVSLVAASRVVTLTGAPGIGKTRLALEVAARLQGTYPGGAWFVDMGPINDADLVAQATGSALGFDAEPGRDPLDVLVRHLRNRTSLLVLDNCEHLIKACANLAERVTGDCDGVSLLVTSRQPLGIGAERTKVVVGLSLPDLRPAPSVAAALESEAIDLFCARADGPQTAFRLTEEVLPAVIEICHRLEGIPLAIELAAARVADLGPAEIAERLEQIFRVRAEGTLGAPVGPQTLDITLDWSYGLLADDDAILFRRLSVFAGSAGPAAVEDVCGGRGVPRDEIVDLLASLVTKSLVVAETIGGRARYRMHETVRAYGRQRLDESSEADAVLGRHAVWCARMVEGSWNQFAVGDSLVVAELLDADHDNLRAAMEWAIGADTWTGLRLGAAMSQFWRSRGYFREGRRWLTRMLDAAALASEPGSATSAQLAVWARALWGLGMLAALQGDLVPARAALERSLKLAREGGLARPEAQALNLLGFVSIFAQDPLAAKPLLQESIAVARAAGDVSSVGTALVLLGRAHLYLSEIDEARAAFEECQLLADDTRQRMSLVLGWAALAAGDERRARGLFERAVPLFTDVGDRFEMALLLGFLGELAWARGELVAARAHFEGGFELAGAMGAPFPLVRCILGLANVANAEGDTEAAGRLIEDACDRSNSTPLPYALVRCLHVRGALKLAAGDVRGAGHDYDDALSTAREISDGAGMAQSLLRLAGPARAKGADDEALRLLHEALTMQAKIGNAGVPTSMEAIAGIGSDQGRIAHAARLFGAAETLRNAQGMARRPDEVAAYEADLAHLRAVADPGELATAWAEGAALSRDEAVELALRGRGARDPDRPSYGWASLTPAERRVVDLVAAGLTNREIATKLFVSVRTVQSHLARVFPKLGVTSRRELRKDRR